MLTEIDIERFSIDKFIEGCLKLDWFDMQLRCQNMGILMETTSISRKDSNYKYKERQRLLFALFIDAFYFIIDKKNAPVKPHYMNGEVFLKIKPIIEKLVDSGDLKKEWLTLYDDSN